MMAVMRRFGLLIGAALAACALPAGPAMAHAIQGVTLTNYHSRLVGVIPADAGISAKILEGGARIRISSPRAEALVLGYEDEPFMRIGPGGVFENRNSPSTYRSRTRLAAGEVPPRANAKKAPDWQRTRSGSVAKWYDHRIHFIVESYPPAVREQPGRSHVVREWTIPVLLGNQSVAVKGELTWIPSGSPIIWLVIMVALLAGALLAPRFVGLVRAVTLTLTVAIVLDAVDAFAITLVAIRAGQFVPSLVVLMVGYGLGGLGLLKVRRGRREGVILALFGGLAILILSGISSIFLLFKSHFEADYPLSVARLSAVVAVALGLSAVVLCIRTLRALKDPDDDTLGKLRPRRGYA